MIVDLLCAVLILFGGLVGINSGTARQLGRLGGAVALVTQPYRVAGRRAPGKAEVQDAAWLEIIAALRKKLCSASPRAGSSSPSPAS